MADKRGEELLLLDGNPSVVGSERIPALEKAGNRGIIPSILYFFFFLLELEDTRSYSTVATFPSQP